MEDPFAFDNNKWIYSAAPQALPWNHAVNLEMLKELSSDAETGDNDLIHNLKSSSEPG
eukprot:m.718203 g.718203  ORF g.718203 m.718203 type:complete len:58 (+) comp58809_c1_seq19:1778-1951(+)